MLLCWGTHMGNYNNKAWLGVHEHKIITSQLSSRWTSLPRVETCIKVPLQHVWWWYICLEDSSLSGFFLRSSLTINSNKQYLLLNNCPQHNPKTLHVYADLDWATCVKTRHSFGGAVKWLAGGTIPYKSKFQPTVVESSTEAEFMAAYNTGKMILFICSVLWDLEILQKAATVLYKDNDACTAMGNVQKPTSRTRHMDIKHFSICEWVERDLMPQLNWYLNQHGQLSHKKTLLGIISPACQFSLRSCFSYVFSCLSCSFGTYTDQAVAVEHFVPDSFATAICAAAVMVHAPLPEDYTGTLAYCYIMAWLVQSIMLLA